MALVNLVPQDIPVAIPTPTIDPLVTNRSSRYRFDLLDMTGRKFGELDGVSSGSLEWNANSQIKGGGRITVDRSSAAFAREIRVSKTYAVVGDESFETDIGTFAEDPTLDAVTSITRSTTTFYEGGAALDIEWAADGAAGAQAVNGVIASVVEGKTYTFVARILNTSAANLFLTVGPLSNPLAQSADWQTVTISFVAGATDPAFGVLNQSPASGVHTHVDSVVIYEGEAEGYNGEVFEYAPFSWVHARIRPVLLIDNVPEEPLGVFIPSVPVDQLDEVGGRQEIELLDRTSIMSQDDVDRTYTVKQGTNVIDAVRVLIASTGERVGALTPSSETLGSDMTWKAGTNKLTIINELLAAAGFFALWSDGNGQFRAEKYRPPKNRPVVYQMIDNENSIFIPTLSVENDIYAIPNKVIMTGQGNADTEAPVAVATNENPDSPFSYQRRGRWITDTQQGVESTSLENLQAKAQARLRDLTSIQKRVEIHHAPVPGLKANDVIRFRRSMAEVDALFTVTKTALNLNPIELATTTLTQVIDI